MILLALYIVRAGVESGLDEHVLIVLGCVDVDLSFLFEHPGHGIRRAEVPAEAAHLAAHFGDGARGIVRHGFNEERHPARAVAFVCDLVVIDTFELTRALLHRSLDVLLRHRVRPSRFDRETQPRVARRIAAADFRGHRDLANELREQRAAFGVGGRLIVLDLLPFAVARHTVLAQGFTRNIVRGRHRGQGARTRRMRAELRE